MEGGYPISISFKAELTVIEARHIIKLPIGSSMELPSRGMVMIQGTINGFPFIAPLEPDGKGSHWFEINDKLGMEIGATAGQTMSLNIEPIDKWIEPEIPDDIMAAITNAGLLSTWDTLTTKARWEWLRWIRSTKNPTTRLNRIEVACSKLQKGNKRPCCFDGTKCTIAEVSKSGVLND